MGSTLKDSEMQETATSTLSFSSEVRVPSVREVVRKSIIESARRCFVVAILDDVKRNLQNGKVDVLVWRSAVEVDCFLEGGGWQSWWGRILASFDQHVLDLVC